MRTVQCPTHRQYEGCEGVPPSLHHPPEIIDKVDEKKGKDF